MEDKENKKTEHKIDWEFDKYFDEPTQGLIRQEHVTYKKRANGKMERTTIIRRYFEKNSYVIPSQMDYQDSTETVIL